MDHRVSVSPTFKLLPPLALALSCAGSAPPLPAAPAAPAPAAAPAKPSRPALTRPGAPVVLPIRDPVLRPDLAIEGLAEGPGGKSASVWLEIDSGSPHVRLPQPLPAAIGVADAGQFRLGLGALSASGVSVAAASDPGSAPDRGVLGRPILGETAWEIAWNSGTFTLDAKVWGSTGAVRAVPLVPLAGGDGVEVKINGRPVRMLIATGVIPSALPENLVASLGLETVAAEAAGGQDAPVTSGSARLIVADVEVGGVRFVRRRFLQARAGEPPVLGLDILARFDLQVLPGRGLHLKPRAGDLRASTAQRLQRWKWMPSCKVAGCARGRVVGTGRQSRVEVDFEVKLPRPLQIVMGCTERREPEEPAPWMDWAAPSDTRGQHLVLQAKETVARKAKVAVPGMNLSLVLPSGAACRKLAVLDVAPIPPPAANMPELTAMVVP
jgi:hypothetical protein